MKNENKMEERICVWFTIQTEDGKKSSENLPGGEKIKEWGDKQDDYTQV